MSDLQHPYQFRSKFTQGKPRIFDAHRVSRDSVVEDPVPDWAQLGEQYASFDDEEESLDDLPHLALDSLAGWTSEERDGSFRLEQSLWCDRASPSFSSGSTAEEADLLKKAKEFKKRKRTSSRRSDFVRAVLRTVMANDPNITTLSLAGLSISRRNAKHLAKAMSQNSTVQTLDLSNKGLANAESDFPLIAHSLYSNSTLTALRVHNTGLTSKCVRILEDLVRSNATIRLVDVWEESFAKKEDVLDLLQQVHLLVQSNRMYHSFLEGNISKLTLANRQLNTLEAFYLRNTANLKQLDVSRNRLRELPPEIGNVRLITELKASKNGIVRLPPELKRLTKLRKVDLSHNSLTALPEEMCELHQLADLDVSYNMIPAFPMELGKLRSLERLDARSNKIATLPQSIRLLKNLELLDLQDNKLGLLPDSLGALRCLKILRVTNNPIKGIPIETLSRGGSDLLQYIAAQSDGSTMMSRMKLMIVGCENVGKSTLYEGLCKRSSDKKKRKAKRQNLATNGIEIQDLSLKGSEGQTVHFSTWDFAGQDVYYATHHFFLSHRSVYMLCFNLLHFQDNESHLEYWLQSIRARAGDAPTVLVGTHLDEKCCTDAYIKKVSDYIEEFVGSRFPQVFALRCLSGKTGKGIDHLTNTILKYTEQLPYIPERIPNSYIQLEKEVKAMRELMQCPVVPLVEFTQKALSCGVVEMGMEACTRFLHDLGIICHFSTVDKDIVILEPQWIADTFATVVSATANFVRKGILLESDLKQIWRPPEYTTKVFDFLISLLSKFNVLYRIPNSERIFIPSLLPDNLATSVPISELWRLSLTAPSTGGISSIAERHSSPHRDEIGRVFHFSFMPVGFFSKIMVQLLSSDAYQIEEYWKNGILVSQDNCAVLATLKHTTWIYLTARGARASKAIYSIMESIDSLARDWLQKCEEAVAAKREYLMCMGTTRVPLSVLVPDVSLDQFRGERINYGEIEIEKQIGVGGFARVFKGMWRGNEVAVKELMLTSGKLEKDAFLRVFAEFRKEVAIMSYMKHDNIIRMLGLVMEPFCVVLEYMSLGSLHDYLHHEDRIVNWKFRLAMIYDIAQGMQFLAHHNVIHRDLKTPNVLLNYEKLDNSSNINVVAKVADFGLAAKSLLSKDLKHRAVQNPVWLAPEIMRNEPYSIKADVYSFGVIMWELLTRDEPFRHLTFLWEIEDAVIGGRRPYIPEETPSEYRTLMEECWDGDPAKRPSFDEIVRRIRKMHIPTHMLSQQTPVPSAAAPPEGVQQMTIRKSRSVSYLRTTDPTLHSVAGGKRYLATLSDLDAEVVRSRSLDSGMTLIQKKRPIVQTTGFSRIFTTSLYGVEKKELEMRMTHSEIPRFHRPEQHAANEKKEKQKRAHERESTAVTERDRSKGTDRATSPMSVLSTGQGQRREKDPTKNTLRDLQRITSEGRPGKLRKLSLASLAESDGLRATSPVRSALLTRQSHKGTISDLKVLMRKKLESQSFAGRPNRPSAPSTPTVGDRGENMRKRASTSVMDRMRAFGASSEDLSLQSSNNGASTAQESTTRDPLYAVVLYDFDARNDMELSLTADEDSRILVLKQYENWWMGELNGRSGFFPANYVCKYAVALERDLVDE